MEASVVVDRGERRRRRYVSTPLEEIQEVMSLVALVLVLRTKRNSPKLVEEKLRMQIYIFLRLVFTALMNLNLLFQYFILLA